MTRQNELERIYQNIAETEKIIAKECSQCADHLAVLKKLYSRANDIEKAQIYQTAIKSMQKTSD